MHLTLNSPPQADYRPSQNAHILKWMLRFFVGPCLAFERDLLFLRQVQEKSRSEDRDG